MAKSERRYNNITFEQRLRIIQQVNSELEPISRVAEKENLPVSTVKMIVKKYHQTGKVFEKKSEKVRRLAKEEFEREKREKKTMEGEILPQELNIPYSYNYQIMPFPFQYFYFRPQ